MSTAIMAIDDQQKLEEIRNARLHRLRLLEKRQAIEGFRAPPEVIAEIAQTRAELGMVESAIQHPASAQAAEDMGAGGRWLATDKKLDMISHYLGERMDRMEEHSEARYQWQEQQRERGAARYQLIFILLAIGLLISLGIGLFLIGRAL